MRALPSLLWVCLLLAQSSCRSSRSELVLASFTVNGKTQNRFIVNRVPQYGDGRPDGCLVERQLSLTVSSRAPSKLLGKIKDAQSGEMLSGAVVQAMFTHQAKPLLVQTDSAGSFLLPQHASLQKIEVHYLGYRALVVDLRNKKKLW